jgi:putative endonuclease
VSDYFVYIMTNNSGTLYVGVTNNLERRVAEHKRAEAPSFTQRYKATRLVYYESTPDVRSALEREKQIKGWLRRRKIQLIASFNPRWTDLSVDFSGEIETLRFAQGDGSR